MFVRVALNAYRAEGISFDEAWKRALHALPRGPSRIVADGRQEWTEVLLWAKPAFEREYLGLGSVPVVVDEQLAEVILVAV